MTYKCLSQQEYRSGSYKIVPIRKQDRWDIMKWRNEQLYHLRQKDPLTVEEQELYFKTVIAQLFGSTTPNQILFSFMENEICIGYGGLVHINWTDKNAEISFVMDTQLQNDYFKKHWENFLTLLEKVAFGDLGFHKIFTYAFDLRPHLYEALEAAGYHKEAVLKEHCFFDKNYIDVVIHSKHETINYQLIPVTIEHARLLYDWANEASVRQNSLDSKVIAWENHYTWFSNKLESSSRIFLLKENATGKFLGQIRFDFVVSHWLIDYSVDKEYRGKGLGEIIVKLSLEQIRPGDKLKAVVKMSNTASMKVFRKLGFIEHETPGKQIYWYTKTL